MIQRRTLTGNQQCGGSEIGEVKERTEGEDEGDGESSADEDETARNTKNVENISGTTKREYFMPHEVKAIFERFWELNEELASTIWSVERCQVHSTKGPDQFFMNKILVPPNRFRPSSNISGMVIEHPQNAYLGRILSASMVLSKALDGHEKFETERSVREFLTSRWLEIQSNVNKLFDSSSDSSGAFDILAIYQNLKGSNIILFERLSLAGNVDATGLRQQLEKKTGLFRMNLMGKRVNFAARSVISPDPFLHPEEIGVPPMIASRLTFPETVNAENGKHLRQLVINGSQRYPGANAIEDEWGRVVDLTSMPYKRRLAAASSLLSGPAQRSEKDKRPAHAVSFFRFSSLLLSAVFLDINFVCSRQKLFTGTCRTATCCS